MDRRTFRLCVIWSTSSLVGAIAIPRLWGWAAAGLFLPTGSWLVIVLATSLLSFLGGSVMFLSIPGKLRQALDNLALQLGVRIETIEGRLGDRLSELRILLEQHLASQDEETIAGHEALMAEFVSVFLTIAIADTHIPAGHCKVCGQKHPKASELLAGDPALYSPAAHGQLSDGKTCPVPFLYKLASDRSMIQSRISNKNKG